MYILIMKKGKYFITDTESNIYFFGFSTFSEAKQKLIELKRVG